ncbi:MAG: hypothetical protein RLN79_05000 [Cytophagales bacterium]
MVDFFKINLPSKYKEVFLSNPILDFHSEVNLKTSEVVSVGREGKYITPRQIAYYKGFRIIVFDNGRVVIDGSLHKSWNNGEHNYNDFNIQNIKNELNKLLTQFKINPKDAEITTLEVGVNVQIPYKIDTILQNLFFHWKKPFQWCETKTEGNYYQCKHDQYRIKIYDKSLQYKKDFKLEKELLRVEINYKSPILRNQFKIKTIDDLLCIPFDQFKEYTLERLSEILHYDQTIKVKSVRLLNYSNRNYWKGLIDSYRNSAYQKHKTKLNEYITKNSDQVLKQVSKIIGKKFDLLSQGGASIQSIHIPSINIPSNEKRVCLVTGFGISMQRKDSKLLSHTGLRYYCKFNYKVFKALENRFLSDKWKFSNEEIKIKEIAHNIRNSYFNNFSKYRLGQLKMF